MFHFFHRTACNVSRKILYFLIYLIFCSISHYLEVFSIKLLNVFPQMLTLLCLVYVDGTADAVVCVHVLFSVSLFYMSAFLPAPYYFYCYTL